MDESAAEDKSILKHGRSHSMSGKEKKSLHVLSLGAFFLLLLVNLRS